ncbi:MAG: hypothetical protein H0X18_13950 [Geodermatophilaceae bacterium]|nr:hypothetical protein [Geodermatophilaceae bacterium]
MRITAVSRLDGVAKDGAVESPDPAAALEAAMKGAGVVWLRPAGPTANAYPSTTGPIWHIWSDGACYILTGPGEQPVPGIIDGGRCEVTARNRIGGRAVTWTATVSALDPGDPEWAAVAPKLAASRLNGGDPVAVLPTWPGRLTILCLRPTGDMATAETGLPDGNQAAAPLPTPATTPYRMPSDITRGWRRRRAARKQKT